MTQKDKHFMLLDQLHKNVKYLYRFITKIQIKYIL